MSININHIQIRSIKNNIIGRSSIDIIIFSGKESTSSLEIFFPTIEIYEQSSTVTGIIPN
jgi:hypothetical protein